MTARNLPVSAPLQELVAIDLLHVRAMKSPQANPPATTKSKSPRGKGNPAQQPRIHQVFAIMQHNDQDPNPDKLYPTLGQIAKMIQGNDPEPLSNDTISRILDMMRDDWNLPSPTSRPAKDTASPSRRRFPPRCRQRRTSLSPHPIRPGPRRLPRNQSLSRSPHAVKKACLGITLALGIEFEDIEKALSFHVVGFDAPAPVDPELFKAAMRRILQRQEVTLQHRSAKRPGEVKQKTVEPLHLAMINHALYLWHHDPELEGKRTADGQPVDPIRKFALTRITDLKPTRRKCKHGSSTCNERVQRGMGAFDEEKLESVELRFSAKIAPIILERKWHPSQVVTPCRWWNHVNEGSKSGGVARVGVVCAALGRMRGGGFAGQDCDPDAGTRARRLGGRIAKGGRLCKPPWCNDKAAFKAPSFHACPNNAQLSSTTYAPIERREHRLPHWQQDDVACFITWRLADSLPTGILHQWRREREAWLEQHPQPWSDETQSEYHARFSEEFDRWLDRGSGSVCYANLLSASGGFGASSFRWRPLRMDAFVVMPNHVHVLADLERMH
jgi:hypothetical protein